MRLNSPLQLKLAIIVLAMLAAQGIGSVPTIISDPEDLVVHVGDSATFQIAGSSYDSLRWFRGGSKILGKASANLTLPAVTLADDGARISCVLYNKDGGKFSREAKLKVLKPTRELVTVTGELSDRAGNLIGANGAESQDMVVEVFSQLEGGDTLYSEAFQATDGKSVQVKQGKFVLLLGSGRILKGNLATVSRERQALYIQFSLGSPNTRESLEPRMAVTAMPYALAGDAATLKGNGTPTALGLTAPVGAWYLDNLTGKVWYRTFRTWVLSE